MNPDPVCVDDTITFTASGVVDSGGTKRENCVVIQIPGVVKYEWTLSIPAGYPPPLPALSGEGPVVTVVAKAPGTYSVTFTAKADRDCPPPSITLGTKSASTINIVSLIWEKFAPESTPLDTCPNNGDTRMFPGKRFAIDPSRTIRKKVSLKATIAPVLAGCTVHFKTWDVDDPFDQRFACPGPTADGRPCVANVSLIDGNTSGPDNRGADPGVGLWSGIVDANGEARVTVTVSMQPGNNYRAGAAASLTLINTATQTQADTNSPPQHVLFTDMLTVWRKVWLELDSMGPGLDITYTGVIDDINNNSPHTGDGTVEFDVPDINDNGRFEGGSMTVAATGSTYTIIDNIDVFVDDDYTMSTLIAPGDFAKTATVGDDDTAVLPKTPDANLTILDDKYRNCYVEFTENSATRDNNNIFVATIPFDSTDIAAKALENADISPSLDFWVVHIVTSYQSHHELAGLLGLPNATSADADPDVLYHIHGATFDIGDQLLIFAAAVVGGANATLFYLETTTDYSAQVGAGYWPGHTPRLMTFTEPRVLVHEIGHLFGIASHTPSTAVGDWDGGDYDFDSTQIVVVRGSQQLSSD